MLSQLYVDFAAGEAYGRRHDSVRKQEGRRKHMQNGKTLHSKLCFIFSIICLTVGIGSLCMMAYSNGKKQGIQNTEITTGAQNSCLAYDEASDTLLVGTHSNELVAFQGEKQIWRAKAGGAYSVIAVNEATGYVYAGNENNHVYLYNLADGTQVKDINVQRRVVAMDVSTDGSRIALATSTGNQKANVLMVDSEGTELLNEAYRLKINGIAFTADEKNILMGNSRGEIIKMDLSGEQTGQYDSNYAVLQMVKNNGNHLVLCKNGNYFELDDGMKVLRQGRVTNTAQATIQCIGIDSRDEYVAVGTKEGYLFVMDGSDKQIYASDTGASISGFTAAGDKLYMAGLGDFVQQLDMESLANSSAYNTLSKACLWIGAAGFFAFAVLMLLAFARTGKMIKKLCKSIWRKRIAYLFILPTFILVWMFNYRGIGIAFTRAFTNWSLANNTVAKMDFVGLDNFRTMVTEGYFLVGMKNLVILLVTAVIKTLTVPVLAAWLVYAIKGNRKKYIYRFLFVLPVVVPGVISALTWQKIYDPNIGLLNELLGAVGLTNMQRVWLGDAGTAIWAVVFMGFPFISALAFLVYYGGFSGIGKEIEESARVDGAGRWAVFWKIQMPLIRPQISIMLTLTLIATMQDFNNVYILTGGGPGTSTYVPALELYFNVAQFGRYGYACALGVVLFVFTMLITIVNMKLTKERE